MTGSRSLRILFVLLCVAPGCGRFYGINKGYVTAVPLSPWNRNEPHGIPYYLPKPLLVIAKNVRHIDSAKTGLTKPVPIPNQFDNQASYADLKANVSIPGSATAASSGNTTITQAGPGPAPELPDIAPRVVEDAQLEDGLKPEVYYTYQIVFVPDLSQKYGLRIRGGPGEIRAAMNLVNGWMYTGMGPYYLKDSSTAQNLMACGVGAMYAGRGVADIAGELANLQRDGGAREFAELPADSLANVIDAMARFQESQRDQQVVDVIPDYAEIYIYEPMLTDCGETTWNLIANHSFGREYFRSGAVPLEATLDMLKESIELLPAPTEGNNGKDSRAKPKREMEIRGPRMERAALTESPDVFTQVAANVFDVQAPSGRPEAAALPGGGSQVVVCGANCCGDCCDCDCKSAEKLDCTPPLRRLPCLGCLCCQEEERPQYRTVVKNFSDSYLPTSSARTDITTVQNFGGTARTFNGEDSVEEEETLPSAIPQPTAPDRDRGR